MQAVPNELLQRAYERRPLYILKLPLLWGFVVAFGYVGYWAAHHTAFGVPVGIVAGFCVGMLVRGIGSIGHDAVHGAVSKNKYVTYVLGFWAWSATLMSYTLYRSYHLDHHRIVNMPHDVDRVQVSRFVKNPQPGGAGTHRDLHRVLSVLLGTAGRALRGRHADAAQAADVRRARDHLWRVTRALSADGQNCILRGCRHSDDHGRVLRERHVDVRTLRNYVPRRPRL